MYRVLLFIFPLLIVQGVLAFDQQSLMKVFFSVVLVRGYDTSGGLAYGTGVVVGENKVATNCHVLRKTTQAWISQAEDVYRITSVQVDARHDLCLLGTEAMPLKPVPLGNTAEVGKGDEVLSLGHSNGVLSPMTSGGQVKSIYSYDHGNVIRTNARFSLGASGSPLFDSQGRLIGINTFKTPGRAAYFYAMPVEWLAKLEKMPLQTRLPVSGQAFWEFPDEEKPFFMQIALPHLNEDWAKLLEISQRWTQAEPGSAEAWYELGTAQEGLGKPEEAQQSYSTATTINPLHSEALFRLGVFASKRGDRAKVHNVSLILAEIDSEMAAEFNKAAGCTAEC
ncbi:MAG TPA: trypsin-like peptidase domain-containing protein [Methylophilaceae bacterium]|nr:trypsin-like peptidase domain-containing protein [Methylophilaceae bacterium]